MKRIVSISLIFCLLFLIATASVTNASSDDNGLAAIGICAGAAAIIWDAYCKKLIAEDAHLFLIN